MVATGRWMMVMLVGDFLAFSVSRMITAAPIPIAIAFFVVILV